MTLLTNLTLTQSALTMMAGLVSKHLMKPEIPFTVQVLTADEPVGRLDPARGIVTGGMLAAILWTAAAALVVLAAANRG